MEQDLKNKKVFIALLARDCRDSLKRNIPLIESLIDNFDKDNSIIQIIENDSVDGTKELLADWADRRSYVKICSEDTNQETIPKRNPNSTYVPGGTEYRMSKMIGFRNKYIDRLDADKFDYLIVIDADVEWFSVDGIISSIKNSPEDWSIISANGREFIKFFNKKIPLKYYDLLPYIPTKDQLDQIGINFNIELTHKEMALCSDLLNGKKFKKTPFFPCSSAFAGCGIYNLRKYRGQKYYIIKNNRSHMYEVLCDHVSFNLDFLKEGQNYISRDLLVLYEKKPLIRSVVSYLISTKFKFWVYERLFRKNISE